MNSIYEQLNKINDTESLSEKYNVKNVKELKKLKESLNEQSEYVYYVGWYETDEPSMFNPLYAIDTPDKFPTVRENFANLLKQILKGNKDYSEYVSYPFIVREDFVGNEAEIKTKADLLHVIKEIERGDWEA